MTFELSDGALPTGLTLSADGHLTGKPLKEGEFTFTVTVRDAQGRSDLVELTLIVVRKPWLVFVSDFETQDQNLLYAVDTSSALFPKTLLSTEVQAAGDVGSYAFSADGSRLAFTVDATVDEQYDLYVVDFSGDQPGKAIRVSGTLPVGGFGLKPDGTGVAFQVETSSDTWELRYVDLSGESPSIPVPVGPSGSYGVYWVTNDRILYGTQGVSNDSEPWTTRTLEGEDFGPPALLHYGNIEWIDRSSERVLLTNAVTSCAKTGWLYDFKSGGSVHAAPADESTQYPTYNRQLTHVAHTNGSGGVFVFEATKTAAEPLALLSPATGCLEVFWSPHGDRLVTHDDSGNLRVTTIEGGSSQSEPVSGDYSESYYRWVTFGGNDRLLFAAANELYQSHIVDDVPTEASLIHEPLNAEDNISFLSAAPDGSWAFYVGAQETTGYPGPYAIDLRGDEPAAPRNLLSTNWSVYTSGSTNFGRADSLPKWSPDSSRLAFIVNRGSTLPYGRQLYVADMLHESAFAMPLDDGTCHAGDPVQCEQTVSFMFQP